MVHNDPVSRLTDDELIKRFSAELSIAFDGKRDVYNESILNNVLNINYAGMGLVISGMEELGYNFTFKKLKSGEYSATFGSRLSVGRHFQRTVFEAAYNELKMEK